MASFWSIGLEAAQESGSSSPDPNYQQLSRNASTGQHQHGTWHLLGRQPLWPVRVRASTNWAARGIGDRARSTAAGLSYGSRDPRVASARRRLVALAAAACGGSASLPGTGGLVAAGAL